MAQVERWVDATPARVFEVLSDGWLYPLWVVGTTHMRAVEPSWPKVGSLLHHAVGAWPAMLRDESEVLVCEPDRRLVLEARGRPLRYRAGRPPAHPGARRHPHRAGGGAQQRPGQVGAQPGAGVGADPAADRVHRPAGRAGRAPGLARLTRDAADPLSVQERQAGRGEQRRAEQVVVRQAGQDRQRVAAVRPPRAVPAAVALAAVQQARTPRRSGSAAPCRRRRP